MDINLIENIIKNLNNKEKIDNKEELETLITDLHRIKNDIFDLSNKNEELNNRFGLFWKEVPEKMIKNISENEIVYGKSLYCFVTKIKNGEGKTIKANINGEEIKLTRQADSYLFKDSNNDEFLIYSNSLYKSLGEIQEEYIPVLNEKKGDFFIGNNENNILIEGDNYYALQMLQYTHKRKIDVIYIDPPYNTGNKDFKYNDKFIKEEDSDKHSSWLSFMEKRLILSKELLKDNGFIFLSIDENERHRLRALLEKIFGEENFLADIIWDKRNPKGNSNYISSLTENVLVFTKNINNPLTKKVLKVKKQGVEQIFKKSKELFKKLGKKDFPSELKSNISKYNLKDKIENINNLKVLYDLEYINKEFKLWMKNQKFKEGLKAYSNIDINGEVFRPVSMESPTKSKNKFEIKHPKTNKNCKKPNNGWRFKESKLKEYLSENLVLFGKDELTVPNKKQFLKNYQYESMTDLISGVSNGMNDLEKTGMNKNDFNNPKPLFLIKYLLEHTDKNSVILDFFAGSGSTGQAVWDLNKEDGGARKFILCTNNENNICEDITFERLKKSNEKYEYNESLKYLTINHVSEKVLRKEDDRGQFEVLKEIVNLKYNSFKIIEENEEWYVNENIAILKDFDYIEEFKEKFSDHEYLGLVANDSAEWDIFKEKLILIKKEDNLARFSNSYLDEIRKVIKGQY